ncbi:MAG TPA: CAP domain-containing protein [Solirubrobacterales bacterium]|jgi:uncharacterized protein YkwD|nr:CAP domain-containing protein [Solirubrobacterales bacterium]
MRPLLCVLVSSAALASAAPAAGAAPPQGLIAPASACPSQGDPTDATAVQVKAMHCMVNFARAKEGKPALNRVAALDRAAAAKSADMLRCDQFDHEACGREFTHWFEQVGYEGRCTALGENIAWGTGSLGSVRKIFSAWIHSPGHRENILGPYTDLGVGLRVGNLERTAGAHVWTQELGSRRCA